MQALVTKAERCVLEADSSKTIPINVLFALASGPLFFVLVLCLRLSGVLNRSDGFYFLMACAGYLLGCTVIAWVMAPWWFRVQESSAAAVARSKTIGPAEVSGKQKDRYQRSSAVTISDLVRDWCRERNTDTGAARWMYGLLLVWMGGGALSVFGHMAAGYGSIVGATLVWHVFAPKPVRPVRPEVFQEKYGQSNVPDSLLASLADASDIPDRLKARVADTLAKEGRLTFAALFEIEDLIAGSEAIDGREKGPDFQKMAAFATRSDDRFNV